MSKRNRKPIRALQWLEKNQLRIGKICHLSVQRVAGIPSTQHCSSFLPFAGAEAANVTVKGCTPTASCNRGPVYANYGQGKSRGNITCCTGSTCGQISPKCEYQCEFLYKNVCGPPLQEKKEVVQNGQTMRNVQQR